MPAGVANLLPFGVPQFEERVVGGAASLAFPGVDQQVPGVAGERLGGPRLGVGRPAQEQRPVAVVLRRAVVVGEDGGPLAAGVAVPRPGLVWIVRRDLDA